MRLKDFFIKSGEKNQNTFCRSQETSLTRREGFYQATLRNKVKKGIEVKKIVLLNSSQNLDMDNLLLSFLSYCTNLSDICQEKNIILKKICIKDIINLKIKKGK